MGALELLRQDGGDAQKSRQFGRDQKGGNLRQVFVQAALLFEAGAKGKNLTESQYGVASTKFRWNLSGSFQQCLPRYVSVDARGEDEREFLLDAFSTPQNMLNAIFLKGYQWPFDPRKAGGEGSSFIDILIYQEEIIRGRRVYLDFTRNSAALEKDGKPDFSGLSEEARRYLENCGALLETPFKRLARMNPPSIFASCAERASFFCGIAVMRDSIALRSAAAGTASPCSRHWPGRRWSGTSTACPGRAFRGDGSGNPPAIRPPDWLGNRP